MTRSIRRLIIAVVLAGLITLVGTVGGFFNISDLINQVAIQREDNTYGGVTTTKAVMDSKTVSWTKNYDDAWTATYNGEKPYMLQETLDQDGHIVEYTYIYLSDASFDQVKAYYEEELSGDSTEMIEEETYTLIESGINDYTFKARMEAEDNQTQVTITVKR